MWRGAVGLIDDVPKGGLAALVAMLAVVGIWAALDRRSLSAARIRLACWESPRGRYLLTALVAAAALVVLAEDVFEREQDELVLRLDHQVRAVALSVASRSALHAAASIVSRLTGEALLIVVVGAVAWLVVARRWRDAVVVAGGSLGAWLLDGALKVGFHVPRPNLHKTWYAVTGYGFPSGHALVTVVACGLLAWVAGREAGWRTRLLLYAGAAVVASLAGAARVILDAHWLSDVLGGLAVGVLWLNLVILVASRSAAPRPATTRHPHP